jgi:hypothetical protein
MKERGREKNEGERGKKEGERGKETEREKTCFLKQGSKLRTGTTWF